MLNCVKFLASQQIEVQKIPEIPAALQYINDIYNDDTDDAASRATSLLFTDSSPFSPSVRSTVTTPRRDDSNDTADTLLFYDPDALVASNAGLEAVQVNGRTEQDVDLANELVVIEVAVNDKRMEELSNDKRGQVEVLVEEVQEQEEEQDNDNEMLEENKVPLNGE